MSYAVAHQQANGPHEVVNLLGRDDVAINHPAGVAEGDGSAYGYKDLDSSKERSDEQIAQHHGIEGEDGGEKGGIGTTSVDSSAIIRTGADVSKYVVSMRDDDDPPVTFRGFLLGTLVLVLQSLVTQVYTAKPVGLSLSNIFIILLLWVSLLGWSLVMPRPSWVAGRPGLGWLESTFRFINPGPIGLKEHVVAAIIASSGMNGSAGSEVFATIKLFYNGAITPVMAVFGLFSISMVGVGMVGLLRPIIIYPSECVYWYTLPMVAVFQMLHHEKEKNSNRVKWFWILFGVTFAWEPIVAYIAPWLNGVSVFCLASMGAPLAARKHIARIFGGASANQGLGLFSLSFDPQYVSPSTFAGYPLKWQLNYWIGTCLGGIVMLALYYGNAWNAKQYPFLSASLFLANGTVYPQEEIFGNTFELNEQALQELGPPHLTSSALFAYFAQTCAIGALFTHVGIFWGKDMIRFVRESMTGTEHDPHFKAMKKYKEVPSWWYMVTLVTAVVAAFLTVGLSHTTLPLWCLAVSLICGGIIAPWSAMLYSMYGSSVATNMASKMIAGGLQGGRPVANLFFANYCHQIVNMVVSLSDYLKLGQYLKIPWRVMFIVQVYATILGAYLNWWVISIIIHNKREILLDPIGDNQWSGSLYQGINAQAVSWSLAKYIFKSGTGLHYEIVPLGLLIGACIPVLHWVAKKHIAWVRDAGDLITFPISLYYLESLSSGINSYVMSSILVGIFMQVYLRVHKPVIFREYCYLLSAAIDGAAQIMSFLLSLFVFGGTGDPHPFPIWFANPEGPADHCVGTRTYDGPY